MTLIIIPKVGLSGKARFAPNPWWAKNFNPKPPATHNSGGECENEIYKALLTYSYEMKDKELTIIKSPL